MPCDPESEFRNFLANGSLTALARVFDVVAPQLLLLAHQLVRDAASAEDLVQETFLAAIENADRFDRDRRVVPWLAGILANQARMERRRARRALDPARLPRDVPVDAALEAQRREAETAFHRALEGLPPHYREVIRLRLLHGVEPRAIAATLGRSPDTVKTQLRRGRDLLKRALPAGMAPLLVLAFVRGRGLAAVRAAVLRPKSLPPISAWKAAGLGAFLVSASVWGLWPAGRLPDAGGSPLGADRVASVSVQRKHAAKMALRVPQMRTATLRVLATFPGDRPAVGVRVWARPWEHEAWYFGEQQATTDADGVAMFAHVRGRVQIRVCRGGTVFVNVRPRVANAVRLHIPQGVRVTGSVVDVQGSRIAGATIWMSERLGRMDDARPVVRTDAQGAFVLEHVQAGRVVTARSGDRISPVGHRVLDEGGQFFMPLSMRGQGGALRGTVLGVDGKAQAGARVLVGAGAFLKGKSNTIEPPLLARSDAMGHFLVKGIAPEKRVPVWVRAPGAAIFLGRYRVQVGQTTAVTVQLRHPARVRGVVRTQDGKPVQGAHVFGWQSDAMRLKRSLHSTPAWGGSHVLTRADGSFTLIGLPPGRLELRAAERQAGRAATRLQVASGDDRRWDPILDPRSRIWGTLRDAAGQPLVGWDVQIAVRGRPDLTLFQATDASGGFDLGPCEEVGYRLEVRSPEPALDRPLLRRYGVHPEPASLDLRLPDRSVPSLWFEGGARAPDGSALEDFEVEVRGGLGVSERCRGSDGRFRVGPLPRGRYWVTLRVDALGKKLVGRYELAGKDVDLGVHQFERPGHLLLRCVTFRGRPSAQGLVHLRRDPQHELGPGAFVHLERGAVAVHLQPGWYQAWDWDRRVALSAKRFRVLAGEDTNVELKLARGYPSTLRFEPVSEPTELVLLWSDGAGQELLRETLVRTPDSPARLARRFAPGRYRLRVQTADGRSAEASFEVAKRRHVRREFDVPIPGR